MSNGINLSVDEEVIVNTRVVQRWECHSHNNTNIINLKQNKKKRKTIPQLLQRIKSKHMEVYTWCLHCQTKIIWNFEIDRPDFCISWYMKKAADSINSADLIKESMYAIINVCCNLSLLWYGLLRWPASTANKNGVSFSKLSWSAEVKFSRDKTPSPAK